MGRSATLSGWISFLGVYPGLRSRTRLTRGYRPQALPGLKEVENSGRSCGTDFGVSGVRAERFDLSLSGVRFASGLGRSTTLSGWICFLGINPGLRSKTRFTRGYRPLSPAGLGKRGSKNVHPGRGGGYCISNLCRPHVRAFFIKLSLARRSGGHFCLW